MKNLIKEYVGELEDLEYYGIDENRDVEFFIPNSREWGPDNKLVKDMLEKANIEYTTGTFTDIDGDYYLTIKCSWDKLKELI